jgi:hypothetical protein
MVFVCNLCPSTLHRSGQLKWFKYHFMIKFQWLNDMSNFMFLKKKIVFSKYEKWPCEIITRFKVKEKRFKSPKFGPCLGS